MKEQAIIISGINITLTDAMKEMVQEKATKLFEHDDHIVRMRVELEYAPHNKTHEGEYVAKGQLEVRGNDHIVRVASNDTYKSIDLMVQKLDRMLRRRSRLQKVKRKTTNILDIPSTIPKAV